MHARIFLKKSWPTLAVLALIPLGQTIAEDKPALRVAPNLSCKVVHPLGYGALLAQQAPVIDGKLDDNVWKNAPWTEDFVDIQGDARPAPRFRTRA